MTNPPFVASGFYRNIQRCARLGVSMQDPVVSQAGREDQRRTFGRQYERRILQAVHALGIDYTQRRKLWRLDCRKSNHQYRLRFDNDGGAFSCRLS